MDAPRTRRAARCEALEARGPRAATGRGRVCGEPREHTPRSAPVRRSEDRHLTYENERARPAGLVGAERQDGARDAAAVTVYRAAEVGAPAAVDLLAAADRALLAAADVRWKLRRLLRSDSHCGT